VGELDFINVSRVLVPGGSFCCVLQSSNALWRSSCQPTYDAGWVRERRHITCVGGGRVGKLDLMIVSRIPAPGGSFCCVLQGFDALGPLKKTLTCVGGGEGEGGWGSSI